MRKVVTMITLLVITALCVSQRAQAITIDCSAVTEQSLQTKHKVVKFNDFFKGLVPMKSYVYNSVVYNFAKPNVHCTGVEDHYRIRFNWTRKMGAYQLYSNVAEMCSIFTLFKDAAGNLKVLAGVQGRFFPQEYQIGFFEDRKSLRRVFFIAQYDARFVIEFWLTELTSSLDVGSGNGQDCNVSLLDLSMYQEPSDGGFSVSEKKVLLVMSSIILVSAIVWLMAHCFQKLLKNKNNSSIMYRNSE